MDREHYVRQGTTDAGFEIWFEPERRLLRIHIWGVWDEALGNQFVADCSERTVLMGPTPFVGITDIRDAPIQIPAVKALRGKAAARAVLDGLHRVAFVTTDLLSGWQTQRMVQAAGCQEVATFSTEWEALSWVFRGGPVEPRGPPR